MNAVASVVRNENSVTPAAKSSGMDGVLSKALSVFKGALIVSAVVYVTVVWALQSVARFN